MVHVSKTKVVRWYRAYWKFLSLCCRVCPLSALVFTLMLAFSSQSSVFAHILKCLLGTTVGFLFVITGGLFFMVGLRHYYENRETAKIRAVFVVCSTLLFGIFLGYEGIMGFLMMVR